MENEQTTEITNEVVEEKAEQPQIEHALFDKAVMEWIAPEAIQHEKGWKWFLAAGVAVLMLIAYAIYIANWTLVVALVVLSAVYVWQHYHVPGNIKIVISKVGVKVGNKEYPYQNIDSFWVVYKPPHLQKLNIRSNSRFLPDVSVDLNGQDPSEIREYLCRQIREDESKEETFTEHIIRLLKL